jgi:tRNA dimethylallyltransferase
MQITTYNLHVLGSFPPSLGLFERTKSTRSFRSRHGYLIRLLAKYGEAARPLASLGYKQAVQLLRGEIDPKTALETAQQAHRNYAKRQMTWFRREPEVAWLDGFGDDSAIQQRAVALAGET